MTSSNGNIFRVTGTLCGEFAGPGEFPTQWPVTGSFGVFFELRLNKRLSKQPWGWWFGTPSWLLWRQYNDAVCRRYKPLCLVWLKWNQFLWCVWKWNNLGVCIWNPVVICGVVMGPLSYVVWWCGKRPSKCDRSNTLWMFRNVMEKTCSWSANLHYGQCLIMVENMSFGHHVFLVWYIA